ncbi:MAG TPA: hypothetical protein VF409_09415 [Sphingomonas sp.]
MPRGYRYLVFAIVGGLALFAIGAGAERAAIWADGPAVYPGYRESADDAQKRLPALSITQALKAAKDQQPCRQPQSLDASALCAQWRAADAAERASRWAWWQLLLSTVGVAGLGITLWFNLEAWRQARESEDDTDRAIAAAQKSADAASTQAALAATAYEALERPYIFVDVIADEIEGDMENAYSVSCYKGKFAISIEYVIKNFGKTPAVITEISTAYAIWPDMPPDYRYASNFTSSDLILEAGGVRKDVCRSDLEYDREAFECLRDCETFAFFVGRVDYSDPTGARRFFTEFCWRYSAAHGGRPAFISQAICGEWNRRT